MVNSYNLSEGALQIIISGGDYANPIMQVLGGKKIVSGSSDKERYRILLSDGRNTISFAMLTTQINDKVRTGGIPNFTIIKITRYITSVINNSGKGDTRVLLILDMEIIGPGEQVGERIGSPMPLIVELEANSLSGIPVALPLSSNSTELSITSNGPWVISNFSSIHPHKKIKMTNTYSLSEGALQIIMNGGDYANLVVQVLGCKKINSGASDKERFRLLLSDGRNTISCAMLTTQINDKVGTGGIPNFTVIKIARYITSVVENSGKGDIRVLLILDMEVIGPGEQIGERIGSPIPLPVELEANSLSNIPAAELSTTSNILDFEMTNTYSLSEGALQIIMSGGDYANPIMQVLGTKTIGSGGSDKERYRVLLSDGRNTISFAMLTTLLNDKVGTGGIPNYTVIKITRYVTSVINNSGKGDTRILLILDMEVIAPGERVGDRIGSPTPLSNTKPDNQETSC